MQATSGLSWVPLFCVWLMACANAAPDARSGEAPSALASAAIQGPASSSGPGQAPREGGPEVVGQPPVGEALVTIQIASLVGARATMTVRVGANGAWSSTGAAAREGVLSAEDRGALGALVQKAANEGPSPLAGVPCDAIPTQAGKVVIGEHQLAWVSPCGGQAPPPATARLGYWAAALSEGRREEMHRLLVAPL